MLLATTTSVVCQTVSMESLLMEMPDNTNLARLPSPFYQSLEASSYNRASVSPEKKGWFADSDGTGYIKKDTVNGRTEYVIMEHQGPGCITRMWTPYFYYDLNNHTGPKIRIYIDGKEEPVLKENFIALLTGKSFVRSPFANLTTRAGVFYFPIPFSKSCKITLDRKPFYYCIAYRAYPPETAVKSFSIEEYKKSPEIIHAAGLALMAPTEPPANEIAEATTDLKPNDSVTLRLPKGMHAVQDIQFKISRALSFGMLRNVLLKIAFDGKETVWCPLGDFFCSIDRPTHFNTKFMFVAGDTMSCRWVMPYEKNAKITLINYSGSELDILTKVHVSSWKWDNRSMYFHANWCNYGYLPGGRFFDLNFITIKGQGRIVGDALTVLSPGKGWWGEGDEKIYINQKDISRHFPSQFGTGTEDYYGWAGGVVPTGKDTFSMPFGSNVQNGNQYNPRGYNICLRNRILDDIPFKDMVKFDMEASPGVDIRHEYDLLAYSMMTYWYGQAGAKCNRKKDLGKIKQKLTGLASLDLLEQGLKSKEIHLDHNHIENKVKALSDFP